MLTAVVFTVAILTDTLDGYLARKHNIITRFGKLADPIADKALTGMAFIGLSIIGELPWWVTITMLVREWGITAAAVRDAALRRDGRGPRRQDQDRDPGGRGDPVPAAAARLGPCSSP